MMRYTEEEIKSLWLDFLSRTEYGLSLSRIMDEYPDERSLVVKFGDMVEYNPNFAEDFLKYPEIYLSKGEEAIREYINEDIEIHLRVSTLPKDRRKDIRDLRSVHLGQFISIEGIIRRATEVRPKLKIGAFICSDCGNITYVFQEGTRLQEPIKCAHCGKSRPTVKFRLSIEKSIFVDTQRVEIQENPENLRGGEQPQRLSAYVEDDLAGILVPGDRVVLNGILRPRERRLFGNVKTTEFDIFLDVVSIDKEKKELESIEITEEDEERIKEEARKGDIIERLRDTIAPTIYGMKIEKEALLLQMFGGVPKKMKDGTRIRGDIHILLVGDPGTAKSQLLQYMAQLAPRGIYTSGKGSSAAGLTATAIRDESGRWTLEAGALVLADMGLAAIDEIDKMSSTDRDSIYQAMEQQIIAVTKAGIYATLMARCSILGAANPKYGRFDPNRPLVEQIDLPTPLLSRFDVIFKIVDVPNPEKDRALAKHILNAHLVGEMLQLEEENILVEDYTPKIDPEFFRKYVAYAKRNIFPKLSDEAMSLLEKKYVETRKLYEETHAVAITPRQLEAMIRLAEASARARLSDVVTREDAERAIRIVEYFLKEASTEGGIIDADLLYTGISSRQRSVMEKIDLIMRKLIDEKGFAQEDEILEEAKKIGIEEMKALRILEKMHREGLIREVRNGVYKYV